MYGVQQIECGPTEHSAFWSFCSIIAVNLCDPYYGIWGVFNRTAHETCPWSILSGSFVCKLKSAERSEVAEHDPGRKDPQRIVPSGMTCMAARHWQWLAQTVLPVNSATPIMQIDPIMQRYPQMMHARWKPINSTRPPPASGPVASPAVNANIESAAIESEL